MVRLLFTMTLGYVAYRIWRENNGVDPAR